MAIANDTRGWIMTGISGAACIFGACFICVDLLIRLVRPSSKFQVDSSNIFLSASLSLTFGVMLFSSLYGTLPEAKNYFVSSGFNPNGAGLMTIGFFIIGAAGIQLLTGWLHRYIPSSIVDCDEEHDEGQENHVHEVDEHHEPSKKTSGGTNQDNKDGDASNENTSLLDGHDGHERPKPDGSKASMGQSSNEDKDRASRPKKPTLQRALSSKFGSFRSFRKRSCDNNGPCFGFVDSCGSQCYREHGLKGAGSQRFLNPRTKSSSLRRNLPRAISSPMFDHTMHHVDSPGRQLQQEHADLDGGSRLDQRPASSDHSPSRPDSTSTDLEANENSHHHHVPKNAFLSIGLQTSIAIALHKVPEGFITYATNHANPSLGLSIFLALSIHNLTEGFAMALPLFLALRSRPKAILWSSLLGGISQPAGAGVAAIWLKVADNSGTSGQGPGDGVYGGLFAITSGIMCSVALGLFSESLAMHQSRALCFSFAFLGMGILGISFALTAH